MTQTDSYKGSAGTTVNAETDPTLSDVLSAAMPDDRCCPRAAPSASTWRSPRWRMDPQAALVSRAGFDPACNDNAMLLSLTAKGKRTDQPSPSATSETDVAGRSGAPAFGELSRAGRWRA